MKKIIVGFFSILVIVVAGLFALPFFLNVNDYRDFLSEKLSENSGYTVQLTGPISMTFLPNVHVTAQNITAVSGKTDPFLQVDQAVIHMELWPLLHKKIVVHTVEITGPKLNLVQNKSGQNNWSSSVPDADSTATMAQNHQTDLENGANFHLNIDKIRLKNGTVSLDLKGVKHVISDIDLTVLPKGTPNPFDILDLSGALNYQKQPISFQVLGSKTGDQITVNGAVKTPDHTIQGNGTVVESLDALNMNLRYQASNPKGPMALEKGQAHLSGDINKKTFKIKDMMATFSGNRTVSGDIAVNLSGAKPIIDVHLKTGALNVNDLMGGAKSPSAPLKNPVKTPGSTSESPSPSWPQTPVSFNVFGSVDGRFTLTTPRITYDQFTLLEPRIEGSTKGGVFTLKSLTATMNGGRIDASGSLSPKGNTGGTVAASISLKGITATDIIPVSGPIHLSKGRLNINAILKTSGMSVADFVSHLNGTVSFKLTDGAVSGIDVDSLAQKITGNITPALIIDLIQKPKMSGMTPIEQLDGGIGISNGIGTIQSFTLRTKEIKGTAKGTISLFPKTADITAAARLSLKPDWPGVMVRLYGSWNNLIQDIDTKEIESFLLKKTLKTVLHSGLDKQLKGALEGTNLGKVLNKAGLGTILGENNGENTAPDTQKTPTEQRMDTPEKAIGNLLKDLF